jgi:Peptidase_C39 like family
VETWSDMNATLEIEEAVQNQMKALQVQEGSLASSQAISQQKQATLTSQQTILTSQQQSLVATEQSKNQLLAETNAKEANYEKLLATAEVELNSFSAFAENAGGSKLITGQTACDAWGCYYNQRDAAWGNDPLDGTKYTLASDGCLVTAMAMMMTHYGYRNVTPVTINTNPDNFAAYYPAYLLSTINVNGITASRVTSAIDSNLAAGNPVVVGLKAYGGTHYVVLVAGKKGNYLMRDPYVANGNNISFSEHYTTREIFSIAKVVINS